MTSWIWILVFSWIQVLVQTCPLPYSQPSMKLLGHAIKTYSDVQTSDQCINKCALHADCHSINHCPGQGICEVNNANHLTNPESLVFSAGFQYLSYMLRGVSRCSNKLCSYPYHCAIDNTTEQGYKCLLSCEPDKTAVLEFPRKSMEDKVVYINVMQLTAFTLSMWVQVDPSTSLHTPFSYASDIEDNEILVHLERTISYFYINNEKLSHSASVIDGRWHHVVGTWENEQGNFTMYIDGIKNAIQASVKKGHTIKKGAAVLGLDQDFFLGGYATSEAFQGNLTGVNMWDRVLTAQEVSAIADRCSSSQGNVFKWAGIQDKSSGNVKRICQPFCNSINTP